MKNNPTSVKNGEASRNQSKMQRKISLVKEQQKYTLVAQLQLPRFYSSDEKIQKKKLILQTQQHQNTPLHLKSKKGRINLNLQGPKYSKTQKNETPSKGDPNSLNKVKIIQEKIGAAILKASAKDFKQAKNRQKKIDYHEMIAFQKKSSKQIKEALLHEHKQSNSNKIKYKVASSKKIETERREDHQLIIDTIQTDAMQQRYSHPRTYRERDSKIATQQGLKNPLKQKSKILLRNNDIEGEYRSEMKPITSRNETKLRTLSTFESVAKTGPKLNPEDKQFLKFIELAIKKSIQSHNNLDYPEAFIVTDKVKFQKKFYGMIDQKYQKEYIINLVHTHLAFYMCAHCILEEINTRIMTPLLNKLLQNHQIIFNLLSGISEKQTEKLFSLNKYSTKQLSKKELTQSRHMQIAQIVIQTRGSNLFRNNQIIKRQLSNLITMKNFVHSQLFLKIVNQPISQQPLNDIGQIDKTLKWQVLKMPTKPFLPESISFHRHYLILDLDETLIHYNSGKEVYHIRPFASQFLENISKYYELTVFTAATKEYADQIINEIDKGDFISHRLYRNHLTFLMGQSLKDLSMLGRNIQTTLIVDNLEANFRMHPQNGILIKSWYGEAEDSVLSKLQILLVRLALQFPEDLRKGVAHYANYIQRQITEKSKSYSIKYDV